MEVRLSGCKVRVTEESKMTDNFWLGQWLDGGASHYEDTMGEIMVSAIDMESLR